MGVASFGRLLALHLPALLGIVTGLHRRFQIFNVMLRCLTPNISLIIEPFAASPTRNLMEVSNTKNRRAMSIKLAQLAEKNGANWDVDTNSKGVGATDKLQETILS
tara:strand:+ start:154 stop:471 length:318 start_codon:yes stop_codon:yes gene_type:complete